MACFTAVMCGAWIVVHTGSRLINTNTIKTGGPSSFAEVFTKTAVVVLYFDFIVSKCNFLALYRVLTG